MTGLFKSFNQAEVCFSWENISNRTSSARDLSLAQDVHIIPVPWGKRPVDRFGLDRSCARSQVVVTPAEPAVRSGRNIG